MVSLAPAFPHCINRSANTLLLVNNIGPQTVFPVPEGILDYHGTNYVALTLWALDAAGAKLTDLELMADATVLSGYSPPALSPMPAWQQRPGAY